MIFVTIHQKDSQSPRRVQFSKPDITIGRYQTNDVVLSAGNISKSHAKLQLREGRFVLTDLQSTNRTFINGHAIAASSPHVLKQADKVNIGEFQLEFSTKPPAVQSAPPPLPPKAAVPAKVVQPPQERPPQIRPLPGKAQPPQIKAPMPLQPQQAMAQSWKQVNMAQGPAYSYTGIPQGWLLLTPAGNFFLIEDADHKNPPVAM